jgi:hypothetical protein
MMPTIATDKLVVLAGGKTKPTAKKLEGVAYAGGVMRIGGWGLIGLELGGLEIPGQTPLLAAHENAVSDVLGFARALVRGGKLLIAGEIVLSTDAAKQVHELAQAGFAWQLSVGVEPLQNEYVAAATAHRLNGKMIKSPEGWTFVGRSRLREVSLLPVGADDQTEVRIAAAGRAQGGIDMLGTADILEKTPDPVKQTRIEQANETRRIGQIRQVCAGAHPELEARAIEENWPPERVENEVLRARVVALEMQAVRANRAVPPGIGAGQPPGASEDVLAAAFLNHFGQAGVAEKAFGARVVEAAHDMNPRCLADIAAACLRHDNRPVPRGANAVIRAAFSTTAMSVALDSTAEKIILSAYNDTVPTWRSFCKIASLRDYKPAKFLRPSFGGELEQVPRGGTIPYGLLEEESGDIKLELFAQIYSVDLQALVNDGGATLADTAAQLGRNAARRVSDVIFETLLANTGDFFHSDRSNLLTGAPSALSASALGTAIGAMLAQRDRNGRNLDLVPVTLLVPPELREAGLELTTSPLVARYVSEALDRLPTGNVFRGLALQIEPRLSNEARFSGTSSTAWYLFARPVDAPVIAAFLDGVETPTVETFTPSAELDRLAFSWRVHLSVGACLGDYRAAIKSEGV